MNNLALPRKVWLLLAATIGCLAISPAAHAEKPSGHRSGHHFSMPLDHVLQSQINAGVYTPQRRQAEVKLTSALSEKNPTKALALLQEAAKIDPTFDKPLMYTCALQKSRANYVAAVAACQEATNRLPNYGFYVTNLAEVQGLAKQGAAAIASYDKAEAIYLSNQTPDLAEIARAHKERLRKDFKLP
jgi:tetratricopeptide (TPR) repeat protein